MQDVKAMGNTVVTVKDYISLVVTMMAADGQVRYGYNGCVLVTSCLASYSVTVFTVFNVFVVFVVFHVMPSCGLYVFVSLHVSLNLCRRILISSNFVFGVCDRLPHCSWSIVTPCTERSIESIVLGGTQWRLLINHSLFISLMWGN